MEGHSPRLTGIKEGEEERELSGHKKAEAVNLTLGSGRSEKNLLSRNMTFSFISISKLEETCFHRVL